MTENTYFLVYTSFEESVDLLTDEECGRLFKALIRYAAHGALPENPGCEKYIFPQMKYHIDRDREKYLEKCEKAKKNIAKRWAKEEEPHTEEYGGIQPYSDEYDGIQTYTNNKNKKNNKKNNIDNDSESVSISNREPPALSPAPAPTREEIEDYCKRRGLNVNPRHFFDYYSEKGWKTAEGVPIDDWYSLIENWHKKEHPLPVEGDVGAGGSFDTDDFFAAALARSYEGRMTS